MKPMKNPLDMFFSLGEKVTKGDPKRKANFDYSMLWVIFLAFFSILVDSLYIFFRTLQVSKLGWAFVMFGILWFQYFALKSAYEGRKLMKNMTIEKEPEKIENVKDMFKSFNKKTAKKTKGGT